ncbi:MAG: helix-turn-helix domain-containing protein [Haliscomenobacter sp.]|nr:helix-turn-helix domain-containing protein [Haliscomenobacter sp.]
MSHYTLLALAYECGFNSKSTFNRAVKKATGKMPSDFIKG